jgi:AP-4 complex subunit beta-1
LYLYLLQLTELSPTFAETHNYIPQLYTMLQDADANVVTNTILALNELQLAEGGMQLTQATVMSLLNRLGEFSEWGLNYVLELVARYHPRTEDEVFAIMNLLDPVLRTANSGAVLATIKCFMSLTASSTVAGLDLLPQIYTRTKPPMLTFVNCANFEVQFTVLKHLETILIRAEARGIYDQEFRQFFVRYNEPSHVKQLKVQLLPLIANETNGREIVAELGEYVVDVDKELSKKSIEALAGIAIRVGAALAAEICATMVEYIDLDIPYVRAATIRGLISIIRVFPTVRSVILPIIPRCLRGKMGEEVDASARASMIWLLAEFGDEIIEAPYYLETIIDHYEDEAEPIIRLQLLTAATALFFKRPPEMVAMLGRLLVAAVNDAANQDVHDRALLYYRLLSLPASSSSSGYVNIEH